jgi:hypothetical protein
MPTRKSTVQATPTKTTAKAAKPPKGTVNITVPESMKSVLTAFADKIITEGAGPTFTLTDEVTLTASLTLLMGAAEAAAMVAALKTSLVDMEKMFKTGNHPIFPI